MNNAEQVFTKISGVSLTAIKSYKCKSEPLFMPVRENREPKGKCVILPPSAANPLPAEHPLLSSELLLRFLSAAVKHNALVSVEQQRCSVLRASWSWVSRCRLLFFIQNRNKWSFSSMGFATTRTATQHTGRHMRDYVFKTKTKANISSEHLKHLDSQCFTDVCVWGSDIWSQVTQTPEQRMWSNRRRIFLVAFQGTSQSTVK